MLKSVYTAVAFAMALAFAAIAFNPSAAGAQDIAGAQADVEALLTQYADDPDGLEAAIDSAASTPTVDSICTMHTTPWFAAGR